MYPYFIAFVVRRSFLMTMLDGYYYVNMQTTCLGTAVPLLDCCLQDQEYVEKEVLCPASGCCELPSSS